MRKNIKTITITTTVRDAIASRRSTVMTGQKQQMIPDTDLHPELDASHLQRKSKGAKPNHVPNECFRAEK